MVVARAGECLDDETAARFAGGRATATEIADIEVHLDGCATCRRTVAALAHAAPPMLLSFVHPDQLATEPLPEVDVTSPEPGLGERIGRFVTLGTIGRGGMGVVIAAHDPELDRRVAIKLVHPALWRTASREARELLRAEARAMARLVHPNVVAVHDLGTVGDQLFVAMELVEGTSLDAWRRAGPRTWREILDVCLQAGRGIAAAHHVGLVHRDVKPQNVLVDRTGHARITDFGLAALANVGPVVPEASPAGTPAYMSPEQHRCEEIRPASDQFNFCVMLYEMLFGFRPFDGMTAAAVAEAVLAGRVREMPRRPPVPARIRRALRRGLSVDPAARFPDMNALLAALAVAPRWRRFAIVPAIAAAAIAGALLARGDAADPDETARAQARDDAAAVWNDRQRAAVGEALAASGAGHAATTARLVGAELDGYVARWTDARAEVAARNRAGADPTELARRRDGCLARRLGEVAAVLDVLGDADRTIADHAVDVSRGLTPVEVCLDIEPGDVAPEEPERRAHHDALRGLLDHAVALLNAGKDARPELEAIVAAARELDHPALTAEALFRLGHTESRRDRSAPAERLLAEAIELATSGGADRTAALAWIEWMVVAAVEGRTEVAAERAFGARVAVERSGGGDDLRQVLLLGLSNEATLAGRFADADALSRDHLRFVLEHFPEDTLRVARALAAVGGNYNEQHRFLEALPYLIAADTLVEGVLGPDHPYVVDYLIKLVMVYAETGATERARAVAERAVAISPPDLVLAQLTLAALIERDDPARAEALSREVADAPDVIPTLRFSALLTLAVLQYQRLDLAAAAATLDRLLEVGKTIFDPRLAHATSIRGVVALAMSDIAGAESWCRAGDAIAVERFGRDDAGRALALSCLSQALRAGGKVDEAIATATEALRVAQLGASLEDQTNARAELARALWAKGAHDRARALIAEAIAGASGPYREYLIAVDRDLR